MIEGIIILMTRFAMIELVAIIATALFFVTAIGLLIVACGADDAKKVWVIAGLLIAAFTGLAGGLAGGYYFQTYWFYEGGNTYRDVNIVDSLSEYPDARVFYFDDKSYVADVHSGITFKKNGKSVCSAPVLSRSPRPPKHADFWAIADECCSGAVPTVENTCDHWGDTRLEGEVVNPKWYLSNYYIKSVESISYEEGLAIQDEPYYVRLLEKGGHESLQEMRHRNGWLLLTVPVVCWPILALIALSLRYFFKKCTSSIDGEYHEEI